MITVKEVDRTYFDLYDQISMNVKVHSIYKLKRLDSGLSGLIFDEVPVKECIKDYSNKVDMYAYYSQPDSRDEIQFIMYLDL